MVTGCGTSEHGALAAADILREAATAAGLPTRAIRAEQAFELSLAPPRPGSRHRRLARGRRPPPRTRRSRPPVTPGGRPRSSRSAGDRRPVPSASIVGRDRRARPGLVPHGRLPESDPRRGRGRGASVRSAGGRSRDRAAAGGRRPGRRRAPRRSHRTSPTRDHLIVIASGADRPAARELVLKVEEASWLPSAYRDLETFLHGHLPATGPATGLDPRPDRSRAPAASASRRARQALSAARVIGLRAAAILVDGCGRRDRPRA